MSSFKNTICHMLLTLLIIFWNTPLVSAVCIKCHGMAASWGCGGDKDTCPFNTGIAANVASLAAVAVGTVTVVKLLPGYINAWFGHDSLTMISGLAKKVAPGTYSFDDKLPHQVTQAVKVGNTTRAEAVSHIHAVMERIIESFDSAEGDALKRLEMKQKSWQGALSTIQSMTISIGSSCEDESLTSALLYILAVLCGRVCKKGKGTDISLEICGESEDAQEHTKKGGLRAKLVRPTSIDQFFSVLNMWVMVCEATCVAPCLVTTAFLDQVAFKPMRENEFGWQVAFEVIVRYLVIVENSNKNFELGNVFMKSGAWDSVKTLAVNEAKFQHPKLSFRTFGGNPGMSGDEEPQKPPSPDTKIARVSGFTASSKVGCTAFNTGKPHLAKHIHWSSKTCKYNHACDRLLEEKDDNGRYLHCLGDHKRDACDNPKRKQ